MTNKKMTIRDYYNELLAVEGVANRTDLVDFINGRIEMLDRKASGGEKKMTANQLANVALKENILEEMENGVRFIRTGFSQRFIQVAAWMKLFYLARHRQISLFHVTRFSQVEQHSFFFR